MFRVFWDLLKTPHCKYSVVNFRRRWCTSALVHNVLTLFKAGCRGLAMVLIAAAVCNKTGKAIISRQFVELTKSRIEVWSKSWPRQPLWTSPFSQGLVAAFPKLMTAGKQHTFVETDSVRYVYQPLDSLYMLLITTKVIAIVIKLSFVNILYRSKC